MKTNHTDITIVLDRSGSMASVASDTIGGFNRFLKDQKEAPGSATLTLHQFDTEHETPIPAKDIKGVEDLTGKTFVPRGGTALLDAIGKGIIATGERLKTLPEHERAEKVVFVILTDGEENSSLQYTKDRINDMISHQRSAYKWEFVFLGANQDAIKTGTSMGISAANSMSYAATPIGTQSAFAATSKNMRSFRGGQSVNMAYTAEDKEEQKKEGVTQ